MIDLVIPESEGKTVWLGRLGCVLKVTYMHTREDELTYVLEGELGARIGGRDVTVGAGEYLWKPCNVPHTFWNAGPEPARMIELIAPAGFERFFVEVAALSPSPEIAPDPAELQAVADRYGQTFDGMEWAPELMERYSLTILGRS